MTAIAQGHKFAKAPLREGLNRFSHDTEGAMWPLVAPLFMVMLSISFICVDVLQHETQRNALQQTLDRGTLAAATLTNKLSPTSVVNDYFNKANLESSLTGVTVRSDDFGYRKVTAQAEGETPAVILGGSDSMLENTAVSSAEQRIGNVEVALVLDVSGSMSETMSGSSRTKMEQLKISAKEFVDTLMASSKDDRISIAIVPFNGQVNLGPGLASKYNIVNPSNLANSDCVNLPSSAYSTTGLSRTAPLQGIANADTFTSAMQAPYWDSWDAGVIPGNRYCPPTPGNTVMLPSISASDLKNKIDGLTSIGATSINAGMKWGLNLLDPANAGLFSEFIAANQMSSKLSGRPLGFTYEEGMKVIVLMTDGSHFTQEYVNPSFRTDISPIWKRDGGTSLSIFHASLVNSSNSWTLCNSRPFWVPHLGAFHSRPWNGTSPGSTDCYSPSATYSGATAQTWNEVWAGYRMKWIAWQLYGRAFGNSTTVYNDRVSAWRTQTPTTTMDSQLQQLCTLAKANEVVVYGIAYEAPAAGRTQIQLCSSSSAHYFNASGLQIRTAFRTIANNISQLRLIQ